LRINIKYITDTLGVEVYIEQWGSVTKLPYYLIDRYDYKKVVITGIPCLFLTPKGELDTLTAIKKHITNVRKIDPLPIVLELDSITAWRRKSLIEARIPFIAPNCQIYLPFLGVALTERYTAVTQFNEILMPSSQLLLFCYLYQNEENLYTNGMADKLELSAMQISRAVKQLKTLGLFALRKDGVRMVISGMENRRDLFEKAKPHLLNPVRRKYYVDINMIPDKMPLAGLCALSELTMLNPPAVRTFALYGKINGHAGTDMLIDNNTQAEVEVWRYAPTLLSDRTNIVDILSLITSIISIDDERVEQAAEEVLTRLLG